MSFYKIILRIIKKENIVESLQALRKERGAVFVLTALLLPVLFGFLGVGYDVGNLYMHRARLQNVADAAALAGGRAFMESQKKPSNKDAVDVLIDENGPTTPAKGAKEVTYKLSDKENDRKKKHNNSKHKDADLAADVYIYKNLGNLGTNVKGVIADKYSHYALDPSVGAVSPPSKTFYRIGLYEKVKLNFLPVLLGESVREQIVRAGAIVLVSPEETTIVHVGGSDSDDSGVINPSIFDNLFVFSEWLFTRNTTNNVSKEILSSFDGTMVYTHLNNEADSPSLKYYDYQPSQFFHAESDVGDASDEFAYTHLYENEVGHIASSVGIINDPTINTFYDTKAYLDAFAKKLEGYHIEVNTDQAKIVLKASDINNGDSYLYTKSGPLVIDGNQVYQRQDEPRYLYTKDDATGIFYLINQETNDYTTVQDGSNSYKVCYHQIPNTDRHAKCVKIGSDYYLLNPNGQITNIYISENGMYINRNNVVSPVVCDNGVWKYGVKDNPYWDGYNYYPLPSSDISNQQYPAEPVQGNNYFMIQPHLVYSTSTSLQKSNIIHVPLNYTNGGATQSHNYVTVDLDEALEGNENTPIYILFDGIPSVEINGNAATTGRPVILVFLSENTTRIIYEFQGEEFIGTIYAPVSKIEHIQNLSGTFRGNIIAKFINIEASNSMAWIQENHLEKYKYEYIEDEEGDYVYVNGKYRKAEVTDTGTRYKKAIVYEYVQDNENGNYVWENGKYRKVEKGENVTGRQLYTKSPVYEYVDKAIKAVSDDIADKIEKANEKVDWTDEDLKMEIYHGLGLEDDEIEAMNKNPNWYNEQTFGRKKSLYQSWRSLYDTYKSDSNKSHLINLLWPWNEHFGIEEGEDKEEKIEESLRLINFRTEYRDASGIINPFIYLTLN